MRNVLLASTAAAPPVTKQHRTPLTPESVTAQFDFVQNQLKQTMTLFRSMRPYQQQHYREDMGIVTKNVVATKSMLLGLQRSKASQAKLRQVRKSLDDISESLVHLQKVFRKKLGMAPLTISEPVAAMERSSKVQSKTVKQSNASQKKDMKRKDQGGQSGKGRQKGSAKQREKARQKGRKNNKSQKGDMKPMKQAGQSGKGGAKTGKTAAPAAAPGAGASSEQDLEPQLLDVRLVGGTAKADMFRSMTAMRASYTELQRELAQLRRKIGDHEVKRKLKKLVRRIGILMSLMERIVLKSGVKEHPDKVRYSSVKKYNKVVKKINVYLRKVQAITGVQVPHAKPVMVKNVETKRVMSRPRRPKGPVGPRPRLLQKPKSQRKPPGRARMRKGKNDFRMQVLAYLVDKESELAVRFQDWGAEQQRQHFASKANIKLAKSLGVGLVHIKAAINGLGGNRALVKGPVVAGILRSLQKAEFKMQVLEKEGSARNVALRRSHVSTAFLIELVRKHLDLRARFRALLPNLKETRVNITIGDRNDVRKIERILEQTTHAFKAMSSANSNRIPTVQDLTQVEYELTTADRLLRNLERLAEIALAQRKDHKIQLVDVDLSALKPDEHQAYIIIDIPRVPSIATLTPSQSKQYAFEIAKVIEKFKNYMTGMKGTDGSLLTALDNVAKTVLILEKTSTYGAFNPDEITHMMHRMRDGCVTIQESLIQYDLKVTISMY